jgi:hypothetical protein
MISLNEKCKVVQRMQAKDGYGSIAETGKIIGDLWCGLVLHEVSVKVVKGGGQRIEEIRLQVWLNRQITNECDVVYNGVKYSILNVLHNRVRGITTILATFNN